MRTETLVPGRAARGEQPLRPKKGGLRKNEKWYAYAMIAPVMFGFCFLLFGPLLYSFYMSLTDTTLLQGGKFLGLENYRQLFTRDPAFKNVLGNTLYFMVGLVPLNLTLSLSVAWLLSKRIRLVSLFRVLIFTPVVTSIVVWSIVWKYILAVDYGVVNGLLSAMGLERINWFYNAKLTMPMLIVTTVLKGMGMNMVIFLSAIKSVPATYEEAARIDGAGSLYIFRRITIPLISPSIFLALVTTCIGALKIFGNVYVMTRGGPAQKTEVIVYYIYKLAFQQYKFGYGSAVAMVLFVLVLGLTLLQWGLRRRFVYAED